MRFLFRDSAPTSSGAVEVGFTEGRPVLADVVEAPEPARAELAAATGAHPRVMHQVHGADVHLVADDDPDDGPLPDVDALASARDDVALVARAADCVPVLLASPEGPVAAVHAGRRGVELGVLPAAVARLRDLGATDVVAWVGPHICGGCYEVPAELREQVAAVVPETRATTTWGTPSLDLGAGVRAQLAAAGVTDVREVGACTLEDDRWPSYRRDGEAATRFAGVIWRQR